MAAEVIDIGSGDDDAEHCQNGTISDDNDQIDKSDNISDNGDDNEIRQSDNIFGEDEDDAEIEADCEIVSHNYKGRDDMINLSTRI